MPAIDVEIRVAFYVRQTLNVYRIKIKIRNSKYCMCHMSNAQDTQYDSLKDVCASDYTCIKHIVFT
jgi:hypothetical protein